MEENKFWDLAIIGTGPAGLSASIYASRYGIKHAVIGMVPGGLISESHKIDNYPGITGLSGFDLSQKMVEHAKKYSPRMIIGRAISIKKIKARRLFEIKIQEKENILARAVILATGTKRRQLNISGEKELAGKGVSFAPLATDFFIKIKP